ncbi:MAG: hypothetical protein IV092_06075 [Burkholderiaceae bacterium]|nr:hypothetical protein [Burkholderiaceae bacterium]
MLAALVSLQVQAATEREQLRAQRQQIEAEFSAAMRECSTKFQITDCELAAKAQRRTALQPVLKQEQALDLLERQQRAQAQRERVAAKQQAKAQEAREMAAKAAKAASAPAMASSRPAQAEPPKRAASAAAPSRNDVAAERALAASQAEQARRATQRRIKAAQAHEKEVLAREAAKAKHAAPLPLPSSAVQR